MKLTLLDWNDQRTPEKLSQSIKSNKLVLGTTDTVLGLFAAVTLQGFEALNAAKKRSKKPYLILIDCSDRINYYADTKKSFHIENIVKRFWPGPLTIIFKANPEVPRFMVSEQGTIALRMPKHVGIQKLLALSGDLFSTSANIAQDPIAETLKQVNPALLEQVACCVTGGDDRTVPSTIIDCSDSKNIKLIREGAISAKELDL
jgi:L-threonylcarbamoyladenylate synthase